MLRSLALAGALSLALMFPAFAQDAQESCYPMDAMVKDLEAGGGKIVGVANYNGAVTDELLIVQTKEAIMLVGFKAGCFVGYQAIEPAVPMKDA